MQVAGPQVARGNLPVSHAFSPTELAEVPNTTVPDLWASLLHPETQPPWWSVPLTSGMTVVGQYLVLGFDLAFKVRERSTIYFVKQMCINSVFVAMALNTWHVDIHRLSTVGTEHGLVVQLSIRLGMLIASGNFLKAMALWGSLFIQSPKCALGLQPRYKEMESETGFPLVPWGAGWLNPMKWVYAVVLFPHILILWFAQKIWAFFFLGGCCAWCCACGPCKALVGCIPWTSKCGPCIGSWHAAVATCGCLHASSSLFWSTIATVLTLTLWRYPLACMLYWGSYILHMYPYAVLVWIQLWASLCVFLFTVLYAILSCGIDELWEAWLKIKDPKNQRESLSETQDQHDSLSETQESLLQKGVEETHPQKKIGKQWRTFNEVFPKPMIFRETQELKSLDPAYEHDFFNAEPFVKNSSVRVPGIKGDKITIVGRTLEHQAYITITQLLTFVTLRFLVAYMTCPSELSSEGVLGTYSSIYIKTVTERKMSLYALHMENTARRAEERLMGSWAWQQLVECIWKVL